MENNVFGERLARTRKNRNLPRRVIAELLQMQLTAYDRYEFGTREPTLDKLVKLALYFEVSTDYLLGLVEDNE